MYGKTFVQDNMLLGYRLLLPHEKDVHRAVHPERLWNEVSAHNFVRSLRVDDDQWIHILSDAGYPATQTHNHVLLLNAVKKVFQRRIIIAYALPRSCQGQSGINGSYPIHANKKDAIEVHFIPVEMLLMREPPEIRTFHSKASDAIEYVEQLNLSDEALYGVVNAIHPNIKKSTSRESLLDRLIDDLCLGKAVAIERPHQNTPPPKAKEETVPAGAADRPASLGPHDGLHNQEWDDVQVKEGSFKTAKQVDMDNLTDDDDSAKEALLDQGRSEEDVEQVIGSGNKFKTKNLQEGDKLYGFDTSSNKYGAKRQDSMYWLDEAGYNDVKKDYYNNGQWNKEGVKNYLSLPCMNRADVIDVVTVTQDQQAIESTVGVAREQIGYTRQDYSTGMLGKIMPGGGKQITPDPKNTSVVTRLTGTP